MMVDVASHSEQDYDDDYVPSRKLNEWLMH